MKLWKSAFLLLVFFLAVFVSASEDKFEISSPRPFTQQNDKDPAYSAMLHAVKDCEDVSVSRPQLLSEFLHQLWPSRYKLETPDTAKTRDRERIGYQNVWRQLHNMPLIPIPPAPTDHISATEATKVTAIRWDARSAKPSKTFVERIETFRGKLLDPTNYANFLAAYAAEPETGTSGLVFRLRKDEDLTGVTIFISLFPGIPPNQNESCYVDGNGDFIGESSVGDLSFFAHDQRAWEDLINAISKAIASPPETPFMINVRIESKARYMSAN